MVLSNQNKVSLTNIKFLLLIVWSRKFSLPVWAHQGCLGEKSKSSCASWLRLDKIDTANCTAASGMSASFAQLPVWLRTRTVVNIVQKNQNRQLSILTTFMGSGSDIRPLNNSYHFDTFHNYWGIICIELCQNWYYRNVGSINARY
jgi:hypothetical protein